MRAIFLMAIGILLATTLWAQSQPDSTQCISYDSLRIARNRWHLIVFYDLHSTLTAHTQTLFQSANPKPDIVFYYNLDVKSQFMFREWLLEAGLFNDYGFTWIVDSLKNKTTDHFQYKLSVAHQWHKKLTLDAAMNTQTILLNGYRFRKQQDSLQVFLNESYMSPGFIYLSAGIGISLPHQARVHVGLATCKITTVRNNALYQSRQETTIAGIPQGKKRNVEGGINAQVSWPLTQWKKRYYAEGTALIFVPIVGKHSSLDMNIVAHCRLWRYGRLSWRHQLQWNKAIQAKPTYQQWFTLGCYLNNKLQ